MYLLSIYMSLEKYLCKSFDHFLIGLFGVIELYDSLYILEIYPLSGIWFANIFIHSNSTDCSFCYAEAF